MSHCLMKADTQSHTAIRFASHHNPTGITSERRRRSHQHHRSRLSPAPRTRQPHRDFISCRQIPHARSKSQNDSAASASKMRAMPSMASYASAGATGHAPPASVPTPTVSTHRPHPHVYIAELGIGAVPRGAASASIHSRRPSAVSGGASSDVGAPFCGSGPRHVGQVCCFWSLPSNARMATGQNGLGLGLGLGRVRGRGWGRRRSPLYACGQTHQVRTQS